MLADTFKNYVAIVKSCLNKDVVTDIVESLGFEVNRQSKFMMREEQTPSASISPNGYIKDFGGDFSGDVISFVQHQNNCNFVEAINLVAPFASVEPLSHEQNCHTPKPLPVAPQKQPPVNENLEYAKAKKRQHKADITPELRLKGSQELYPHITSTEGLERINHMFGWSKYHNSLTIEIPECSVIRRDNHGNKWRAIKGNHRNFIVSNINPEDEYVYLYSGMAEVIPLELMNLSYIGLQSDTQYKKIPPELIQATKGKTVCILEENDPASQILSQQLLSVFDKVKIINMVQLAGVTDTTLAEYKGYDFRDLVNKLQSFEIAKAYLQSATYSTPTLQKPPHKGIRIIPYLGKYISNQNEVNIGELEQGVVVAVTGSGKTHAFENQPNTLILVPRVAQASVFKGDNTDFLIHTIQEKGAIITFDKFYGHYHQSREFRLLVQDKKIRVIVDEAHMLLSQNNKKNKLIYELDALFLSGTIENFFKPNLPHYKFKPEAPIKMYYTDGKIPDFENGFYHIDKAKALMSNYSNNCFVGAEHNFNNLDIQNHTSGKVFATSAAREGISLNKESTNYDGIVVVAEHTHLWSVKDTIQGLQRVRDDVPRVITKPIQNKKETYYTIEYFMDIARKYAAEKHINAIMGEFYSDFIKAVFKPNDYTMPSEYDIACYLAKLTKDHYDEDLYSFEPYEGEFQELKIQTKIAHADTEDTKNAEAIETIDGIEYLYPVKDTVKLLKWKALYLSGTIDILMKYTEWTSMDFLFKDSAIGKKIKFQYNLIHADAIKKGKKKSYRKYDLYKLLRAVFKIEMADSHGNIIQRVNHKNIKDLHIRIIDRCSVTLKPLNSEELRASIPLEVMDTNFVTFSQDLGVLEASSNPAQNEAKNNTEIVEFLNKEYSKESVESLNNSTLVNSIIDLDKEAIETQDTCVNSVEYEEIDSHLNEKYDEEFMGIDYRDDGRISFFIDDFDKPARKVQKITVEENLRHYTLFGESQYLGFHEHFDTMPEREKLSSQNSFGNRIKIVNHPAIHSGTS